MKQIISLFLVLSIAIASVIAQTSPVSNYVFTQNPEGTYTEISGGTVHGTVANDDESFNAIDIGFTFNYNAVDYTQISIQTNGYIAMGSSVNTTNTDHISSSSGSNNIISGFGVNMVSSSTGEIMTKLEGTAPNRIYTIQWKNYMRNNNNCVNDIINFQIKLYETSNKIEFVYGDFSINDNIGFLFLLPQIGLRGNSNSDFNNRKTYFGHIRYKWENSIIGTNKTDEFAFDRGVLPQSGLTFTYAEPAAIDVGIIDITNIDRVLYSEGTKNIETTLKNFGTTTLNTATIKWKINNGTVNSYSWTGSLTQGGTAENINIGTFDFTGEGFYDIEVWTENPNGNSDENPENDSFTSYHTLNLYCSSNIVNDEWWYIKHLTIGNIVHVNIFEYETEAIADYSTHFNAEYSPGSNLNYAIEANAGGWFIFWIDLNDDNDYDETEYLGISDYTETNAVATGVLTLPVDAAIGKHKLRVRYLYAQEPTAADACTPLSQLSNEGDAHEYAITIYSTSVPPPCASNPTPANSATNVVVNEVLEWESTDATSFDVYFGTNSTPPFIINQEDNFYNLGDLEDNTTYYWKVIAKNEFGSATGCETWSFTTGEDIDYCIPPISDCDEWGDAINSFLMEDLIHEVTGCSDDGYGDFTDGTYTTSLIQGANVQWSAFTGSSCALAIWIDFDDDGIFNETDEFVYHTELDDGTFVHIEEGEFTIPSNAAFGVHRMRVRAAAITEFQGEQACTGFGYSETHDYIITIAEPTEPPTCANTPFPENTSTNQFMNTDLTWSANQASSYEVYFGTTTLDYIGDVTETYFDPGTLDPNTEYQWKIIPKNSAGQPTDCDIWTFTTGEELLYCTDNIYVGDAMNDPCEWNDYIDDFSIGDLNHTGTGCNGGYNVSDYTTMTVDLAQGSNYTWTAELGNANYLAIWFDTNNDGTFDETECLYTSADHVPTSATGTITIPATASLGEHRLRIRLSYQDPAILPSQACTQFVYGEAHDYTVNVNLPTQAPECAINPTPANEAVEISLNYGEITWQADYASEFDVYFGTEATPPLVSENQIQATYSIETLEANTTYYWKVIPSNVIGGPEDCETWSFTTSESLEYCINIYNSGPDYNCTWGDAIDNFSIADFEHLATGCGNEEGIVMDYSHMIIELERGNSYDYTVTNNHANYNHFAIWIDYNNDGEFNNSNEFLYSTENIMAELTYSDTLYINETAPIGEHRMRLRLKSYDPAMTGDDACTYFVYGEAHDYTVNITGDVSVNTIEENIRIYPNPASDYVRVKAESKIINIAIYNYLGQQVIQVNKNDNIAKIDVSSLNSGVYFLKTETKGGSFVRKLIIQ